MIKHSKSLLLSLLIHSLILLSLLGAYKYIFMSSKPVHNEQRMCVRLTCIKQTAEVKQVHKEKKQKIQKKTFTKKTTPKHIKRKTVPVQKEIPKIMQKPVESVKEKQEQEIEKEEETETKPQTKKKIEVVEEKVISQEAVQEKLNEKEQYIQDNLAIIAQLIKENLYYPRRARKRGIQGSVIVHFRLLKDATVTQVTASSLSNAILTRAAIKTITELSGQFPKPKKDLMLSVPIEYKLR